MKIVRCFAAEQKTPKYAKITRFLRTPKIMDNERLIKVPMVP